MIYDKPGTFLDVFSLHGRYVASFDISKLIQDKISTDFKLTKLDYVLIPVLKWTGRRNKLPQQFGKAKQTFDAPKVVLFGQV